MRYILLLVTLASFYLAVDFIDVPHYTADKVIVAARNYSPTCQLVNCG